MARDVKSWCKECAMCQYVGEPLAPMPLQPSVLPPHAWHTVAINFKGPLISGDWLLVLIDYYSRYPEVQVMKTTTTHDTVQVLQEFFSHLGPCVELVNDNGQQFCSTKFRHFLCQQGIRHWKVCPLYPTTNGLVERFNRCITALLEKVCGQNNWKEELFAFLFAYHTTKPTCPQRSHQPNFSLVATFNPPALPFTTANAFSICCTERFTVEGYYEMLCRYQAPHSRVQLACGGYCFHEET